MEAEAELELELVVDLVTALLAGLGMGARVGAGPGWMSCSVIGRLDVPVDSSRIFFSANSRALRSICRSGFETVLRADRGSNWLLDRGMAPSERI